MITAPDNFTDLPRHAFDYSDAQKERVIDHLAATKSLKALRKHQSILQAQIELVHKHIVAKNSEFGARQYDGWETAENSLRSLREHFDLTSAAVGKREFGT